MRKRLFIIAAILCVMPGVFTVLSAQNYSNQDLSSRYVAQQNYYSNNQNNDLPIIDLRKQKSAVDNSRENSPSRENVTYNNTNSRYSNSPVSSTLSSFMRNSAGTQDITKYLANDASPSSITNYQRYYGSAQPEIKTAPESTAAPSYTNVPSGYGVRNETDSQSKLNTPVISNQPDYTMVNSNINQYNTPQTSRIQNGTDLQADFPVRSSSDQYSQTLNNIEQKLNQLEMQLNSNRINDNKVSQETPSRYSSNISSVEVTSTSELYGANGNYRSGVYPEGSTNVNTYQPGVSSPAPANPLEQSQYNELASPKQNTANDESLDEIKRKLDDITKYIDSHMKTEKEVSSQPETNAVVRTEQGATAFQSYSKSQFNKYFTMANQQQVAGKYYEAADSFTLAAVYEPDNPFCYAGQGHALFAAGQYVSSALFIIRAIEIDPEYIQSNVDLSSITGGHDLLAGRISELEQLLKKAPATGLQFLLGYVYYRTGKLPQAKQMIDSVYQEMPQSRATLAIKMAIDFKL